MSGAAGRGPRLRDLAELRLLLAWRRLKGKGGLAEGVAQFLLFALAIPGSLLFSVLVGLGSFRAARAGGGLQSAVTVGAILFGLWQTWTMVGLVVSERDALDLRRLLVYPVPPARLYLLGVASSLVGDPFAAFWLVVLAGMWVGAAAARPGLWLAPLALALALFALTTVALLALAQEVLARLSRSRRWREVAVVAGIAGWLALAAAGTGGAAALRAALPLLRHLRWILWPAALASEAVAHLYGRRPLAALPFATLLAAGAALAGGLAYRVALATARSGGEAGAVSPSRASRGGGWFPERLGPLFEKELRYLVRHPAARIHLLLVPVLAAFLGWRVPRQVEGEAAPLLAALPLFGIAAYVHLALQLFWLNGLGFDRGGVRAFFLAPVAPEAVLLAKNGALLAWALAVFGLSSLSYVATAGPQPWWAASGALALVLGLAPVLYGLGNLLAVVTPRAASHGLQRAGAVSPLAALAGMAVTSGAVALYAVPVLLAASLDALWAVPVAWAALGALAFAVWRATLPLTGRLLSARRERILAAVCGDDV